MKRTLFSLSFSLSLLLAACGTDDSPNNGGDTGGGDTGGMGSQSYELGPQAYVEVAEDAQVIFSELEDGSAEVTIDFGGEIESDFDSHPAHIHVGDAGTGGDIIVPLEPVDGATGQSVTVVPDPESAEDIPEVDTYEELIAYDGYVNVHLSEENLDVVFASANIGANAEVALPAAPTIAEQAAAAGNFTVLLAALTEAELASTFADAAQGPFTVLAPTDDAFAALLEELDVTQEELLAREDLGDILSYHVLPNVLVRSEVVAAASTDGGTSGVETLLEGATLSLAADEDGSVIINDRSQVIVDSTNITASNGVIHAVDTVLLPPAEDADTDG